MLEAVLKDCLAAGKQFKSAQDFYLNEIKTGNNYIVVDDGMPRAEIEAMKARFAAIDREELARLQGVYANKWTA